MERMFFKAVKFSLSISSWNVNKTIFMQGMLAYTLHVEGNKDTFRNQWERGQVIRNNIFDFTYDRSGQYFVFRER